MGMTDEDRRRLKGSGISVEPEVVRTSDAMRIIGASKSELYRLLAARKLRAVKRGATTLVLMSSIREHMASLPAATFGTQEHTA